MSVLVKGAQMPKGCAYCPCFYDYICCQALPDGDGSYSVVSEINEFKERLPNCPLVEIPSGERLIGADTLCRHILYLKGDDFIKYGFIHIVECEPSIVEAEETDERTLI